MKQYTMEGIRALETTERLHVFTWLKKIKLWDEYMSLVKLARAKAKPSEQTHAVFVGVHHEDIIAAHYLCHLVLEPNELTQAFCIVLFPFAEDDKALASRFLFKLAEHIMQSANQKNEDNN